jgi:hypothetical protein
MEVQEVDQVEVELVQLEVLLQIVMLLQVEQEQLL